MAEMNFTQSLELEKHIQNVFDTAMFTTGEAQAKMYDFTSVKYTNDKLRHLQKRGFLVLVQAGSPIIYNLWRRNTNLAVKKICGTCNHSGPSEGGRFCRCDYPLPAMTPICVKKLLCMTKQNGCPTWAPKGASKP